MVMRWLLRLLGCALCVGLSVTSVDAQPAFAGTPSSSTAPSTNTRTFAHTVGSGNDRLLIVHAVQWNSGVGTVSSVTYNGVALTQISGAAITFSTNFRSEGWYLIAPDVGTFNVVVTWSASQTMVSATALNYTGVHQSNPFGTAATNSGNSTTPTVDVTSAAGELVFAGLFVNSTISSTAGTGQTERYDFSNSLPSSQAGSDEAGAATVTMNHTVTSNVWGMWGVSLKPPAAGGSKNLLLLGVGEAAYP